MLLGKGSTRSSLICKTARNMKLATADHQCRGHPPCAAVLPLWDAPPRRRGPSRNRRTGAGHRRNRHDIAIYFDPPPDLYPEDEAADGQSAHALRLACLSPTARRARLCQRPCRSRQCCCRPCAAGNLALDRGGGAAARDAHPPMTANSPVHGCWTGRVSRSNHHGKRWRPSLPDGCSRCFPICACPPPPSPPSTSPPKAKPPRSTPAWIFQHGTL